MEKQWYFPKSNGLGINGASDGGLETFKGDLIRSLTREICQNSLDAAISDEPVELVFQSKIINTKNIPGVENLKKIYKNGTEYWKQQGNKKAITFFEKAEREINSSSISLLQISDFNTTGLTGSNSNVISPWLSMVTAEGVSDKNGSSGGSYGIGKSSIYAVSKLHCAFFNTLDKNGIRACQGVAKLPSFMLENSLRFGRGYYGVINDSECKCCNSIQEIDNFYKRNKIGTDIFILGFNAIDSWKDKIICSLLDNFLLAIYSNKLVVKINDIEVNKNTLEGLLNKYSSVKEVASAKKYYDILSSNDVTICSKNLFPELGGEIILKIKIFRENTNRSVLISRSNGMKLFDKKNISGSIQFSAILTMHGDKLNEYFAKMENPAHDNWQPDRYEDEELINEASEKCAKLYRWIKNEILKVGEEQFGDEVDIEGLEGILPEFYDIGQNKNEFLSNKSKNISIKKRNKKSQTVNFKTIIDGETLYEIDSTGVLDPDGDLNTIGIPVNLKSTLGGGSGVPTKGVSGDGNRPIKEYKAINNFNKRIFISNASLSEYTLVIKTNQNLIDCQLVITISGETSNVDCDIKEAFNITTNKQLEVKGNKICLNRIAKGFQYKIKFKINVPYICSLGVKLYANNQ